MKPLSPIRQLAASCGGAGVGVRGLPALAVGDSTAHRAGSRFGGMLAPI